MDIFCSLLFVLFWNMLYVKWTRAQVSDDGFDRNLLEVESTVLDTLQNYIENQEARLTSVKQQLTRFTDVHEQVKNNSLAYLSNPINRYLFVRRLTKEKQLLEILLKQDLINNLTNLEENINFLSEEELDAAADTLIHLQATYKLDTQSFSRGEINGIKCAPELSVDECFDLGEWCFTEENYELAASWLREALRKYDINPYSTTTLKFEILDYLAYSAYKLGEVTEAFEITKELLSIDPEYQLALNNLALYETLMNSENAEAENEELGNSEITTKKWEQILCRKEVELPTHIRSTLKCRYISKGNPFLFIAPLKQEEAYLNPLITLYHDVLYDTEIETIKNLAGPKLERAKVHNLALMRGEISSTRFSKVAWLTDSRHPFYQKLMRRVQDMTLLNTETVEGIQVANYGIGGHYKGHWDFYQNSGVRNYSRIIPGSERVSTVLFYMNDLEEGGATVFPSLNFGIWPKKGTAVVWYNVHTSGAADFRARHASCPVLRGFKWVAIVLIQEQGQVFVRPCHPDDPNRQFVS